MKEIATEFGKINFMCKCNLYEKGDSENEHHNKHFAVYFAMIVLKYSLGFQNI